MANPMKGFIPIVILTGGTILLYSAIKDIPPQEIILAVAHGTSPMKYRDTYVMEQGGIAPPPGQPDNRTKQELQDSRDLQGWSGLGLVANNQNVQPSSNINPNSYHGVTSI